jgi:hypothetical protein
LGLGNFFFFLPAKEGIFVPVDHLFHIFDSDVGHIFNYYFLIILSILRALSVLRALSIPRLDKQKNRLSTRFGLRVGFNCLPLFTLLFYYTPKYLICQQILAQISPSILKNYSFFPISSTADSRLS